MLQHVKEHQEKIQKSLLGTYGSEDTLEKGGKRATIGEVRNWGNEKWVKHQDGWVKVNTIGDKPHLLERPGGKREQASEGHVSFAKQHLERHQRETGGGNSDIKTGDTVRVGDRNGVVQSVHQNSVEVKYVSGETEVHPIKSVSKTDANSEETSTVNQDEEEGDERTAHNIKLLIDAGYSQSDAEDFVDEHAQGGDKIPQKVKDILEGDEVDQTIPPPDGSKQDRAHESDSKGEKKEDGSSYQWTNQSILQGLKKFAEDNNIKVDKLDTIVHTSKNGSKTIHTIYSLGDKHRVVVTDDKVPGAPRLNSIKITVGDAVEGDIARIKNAKGISDHVSNGDLTQIFEIMSEKIESVNVEKSQIEQQHDLQKARIASIYK